MAKYKNLPHSLTDKEKWQGLFYLIFELCFLPSILHYLNSLLAKPVSSAWLNFLYFTLNFVFICVIFKGFFKKSLSYISKHIWDFLKAAVLGFGIYWLVNFGLNFCIQTLFPDFSNLNDSSIAGMTAGNFTIMALSTVIFVPVVEETLHRGLIFGTLYKKNKTAAYFVSAMVFAAIHVMGYVGTYAPLELIIAVVQYLPAGFILAWAYQASGSIFAPILIHAFVNALGIYALR